MTLNKDLPSPEPETNVLELFADGILELDSEKRRSLAIEYIDKFSGKKVDGLLLKEAGINPKAINPRPLVRGNPALTELATRLNYCQYLLQDQQPLPFSQLSHFANMTEETVRLISRDPRTWRVVKEPFYAREKERLVKQYDEDDKKQAIFSAQEENKATRIMGQGFKMPSASIVGVLYFSANPGVVASK